jgi:hypothetical protein
LNTKKVGDTVQLTIGREGAIKNISLTLAATPSFMSETSLLQLQPLGMNTFYGDDEYNPVLHIVGEFLNNTTQTATLVQVSATLYDINNRGHITSHLLQI